VFADPLNTESATARFRQAKVLGGEVAGDSLTEHLPSLLYDHMGLRDQPLLSRFDKQLDAGLYDHTAGSYFNKRVAGPLVLQHTLEDFYDTASSQADMAADFARAQVSRSSAYSVSICS